MFQYLNNNITLYFKSYKNVLSFNTFKYFCNSNDNDFIRANLGGMCYKKTIPNCKFIRGRFQIGNSSCNVSKCPYES